MTQSMNIKTITRPCKMCKTDTEQEKQGVGKETRYVCLSCLMNPDTVMSGNGSGQGKLF